MFDSNVFISALHKRTSWQHINLVGGSGSGKGVSSSNTDEGSDTDNNSKNIDSNNRVSRREEVAVEMDFKKFQVFYYELKQAIALMDTLDTQ